MVAFIKRKSDFKTVISAHVISWDVPLNSIEDDVGNVVLYGTEVNYGNEGDFLIMDGHIWVIEQVTPDRAQSTVSVGNAAAAFDRPIPFTEEGTTIGSYLAQLLNDHYKEVDDPAYQMPYLNITNLDNTEYLGPTVTDGLFNLKTYIRKVNRLRDVIVRFSVEWDTLNVTIEPRQRPRHQVVFDDGVSQLISQAYSRSSIAKVTAYQNGAAYTYYLSADGTVTDTVPTHRAEGSWEVLALTENEVLEDRVQDIFSTNSNSHKIEWRSTKAYDLYDTVVLRLGSQLMTSYVSYIGISSGDNRYYYKSGELKTTLTERLKGVN